MGYAYASSKLWEGVISYRQKLKNVDGNTKNFTLPQRMD